MRYADRVPVKSTQSMLHWLKWGVPISEATGWLHYPFTALSNIFVARSLRPLAA
jgi:hypothetical protein